MSCWSRSNEAPQRLNRLILVPSCPQGTPRVLLRGQTWSTCLRAQRTPGWPLTLFKLYPNTRVILDLLNHLSAPADDHPHRMPRHWHLRAGGTQESQLGSVPSLRPSAARWPTAPPPQPSLALHPPGEACTHINAPADPGSILIPVPKATLVTLPKDVHHHLAGLLQTHEAQCSYKHRRPTACPGVTGLS